MKIRELVAVLRGLPQSATLTEIYHIAPSSVTTRYQRFGWIRETREIKPEMYEDREARGAYLMRLMESVMDEQKEIQAASEKLMEEIRKFEAEETQK